MQQTHPTVGLTPPPVAHPAVELTSLIAHPAVGLTPLLCVPQVQRFLEAAGQAPDLVERYCGLYQRLRGATEELFGPQAAFVLALGQGFAGALLQLSFLAALHVSRGSAASVPGLSQLLPPGLLPQPSPAAASQG